MTATWASPLASPPAATAEAKRGRGRPRKEPGFTGSSAIRALFVLYEFEQARQAGNSYTQAVQITCRKVLERFPGARCSPTEVKTVLAQLQPRRKSGQTWRVVKTDPPDFGVGPMGDYLRNLHQGGETFALRAEPPQEPPTAKRRHGLTFGKQGTRI